MWIAPITDRTQADIENRSAKAYCNAADLNRLEGNCIALAGMLGAGITPKAQPWSGADFPTNAELGRILANITTLRQAYYSYSHSPSVPLPPFNTWQKWNDAEQLLLDIYTIWNENQAARSYAGELYSGQQIGVI